MRSIGLTSQAGAFAAFTIDLLVYPMDTIKTRLQSRDFLKTYAASPAPSSGAAAAVAVRRAASSVYAFRGLYQGLGIVIIATLPSCALLSSSCFRCRAPAFCDLL